MRLLDGLIVQDGRFRSCRFRSQTALAAATGTSSDKRGSTPLPDWIEPTRSVSDPERRASFGLEPFRFELQTPKSYEIRRGSRLNLFDMFMRRDRAVTFGSPIAPLKVKCGREQWRGLLLQPGARIEIPGALGFYPIRERPSTCGWTAMAHGAGSGALRIGFSVGGATVETRTMALGGVLQDVLLPWPADPAAVDGTSVLVLETPLDSGPVFLGIGRVLDRQKLLAMARGDGVEIGPGPRPQIRVGAPANVTSVIYVEQQKSPERWIELYGDQPDMDPALWDDYVEGTAADLPVGDASLDFIFSSHVFEHLANPLGHLRRWKTTLRPGGRILAVVPELGGAKDYRQDASTMADFIREDRADIWEPTEAHYERYVQKTMRSADAALWIREKRSIHVHFYTPRNTADLLRHACETLGFASFDIFYSQNTKDFHFVLEAGT
jgi:predicted SAM-dependent methyltransferase